MRSVHANYKAMKVRLGRANTCLRHCCYLCLVCLRPATQPFQLSLRRIVQLTCMNGARGKALVFWSGGRAWFPPSGGCFVPSTVCPPGSICWVVSSLGGQFIRWLIHKGRTVWWTIRKWRNQPYSRKISVDPLKNCPRKACNSCQLTTEAVPSSANLFSVGVPLAFYTYLKYIYRNICLKMF